MEKPYIRNPKGFIEGGSKFGLSDQDQEDFEQEQLIKEWLESAGGAEEFEYKHITSKGTARNTIDTRSVRLDQKVFKDSEGTYADFIAGSDGRDLECRLDGDEDLERSPTPVERLDEELNLFFDAIGVSERTKKWGIRSVKSAESLRKLRSLMKDEKPLQISPINLESLKLLPNFKE